jgi:hypothetical protein
MKFVPSGRALVRTFSPLALKAAFWGTVYYLGPVKVATAATAAAGTVGVVPLAVAFAFVNFGGVDYAVNLLL